MSWCAWPCVGSETNVLVCLAVCWERRLQNMTNYFLMSLAIADLLVSVLVMPFAMVVEMYGYFPLQPNVCVVWASMDVLLCTASIWHMSTMSVDRYCTIRYPIRYGRNRTKTTVALKITFVWIISLAVSSGLAVSGFLDTSNVYSDGQCVPVAKEFVLYGSLMAFYVPLIIMVVTYALTVRILTDNRRTMRELGLKTNQTQKSRAATSETPSISVDAVCRRLTTLHLPTCRNSNHSSALTLPGISEVSRDSCSFGRKLSSMNDPPVCHRSRTPHVVRLEPRTNTVNDTLNLTRSLLSVSPTITAGLDITRRDEDEESALRSSTSPTFSGKRQLCRRHEDSVRQSVSGVVSDHKAPQEATSSQELQAQSSSAIGPRTSANTDPAFVPSGATDTATSTSPPGDIPQKHLQRNDNERRTDCDVSVKSRDVVIDVSLLETVSSVAGFISAHRKTSLAATCFRDPLHDGHWCRSSDFRDAEPTAQDVPSSHGSHSTDDIDAFGVGFETNLSTISRIVVTNVHRLNGDKIPASDQRVDEKSFINDDDCTSVDGGSIATVDQFGEPILRVTIGDQECVQLSASSVDRTSSDIFDSGTLPVFRPTTTSRDDANAWLAQNRPVPDAAPPRNTHRSRSTPGSPLVGHFEYCPVNRISSKDGQRTTEVLEECVLLPLTHVNQYVGVVQNCNPRMRKQDNTTGASGGMTSSSTQRRDNDNTRFDLPTIILPSAVTQIDTDKSLRDHHLHLTPPMSRMPSSFFADRLQRNSGVTAHSSSGERTLSLTQGGGTSTSIEAASDGAATRIKRHRSTSTNERKASKVLGIIFSVFIVLWSPFFVVNVLAALCGDDCRIHDLLGPTVMSWFVWLGYTSSLANPFIYTVFSTKFRTVFRRIITCQATYCSSKDTCRIRRGSERDHYDDRWSGDRRRRVSLACTGSRVLGHRTACQSDANGYAGSRRYTASGAHCVVAPQGRRQIPALNFVRLTASGDDHQPSE